MSGFYWVSIALCILQKKTPYLYFLIMAKQLALRGGIALLIRLCKCISKLLTSLEQKTLNIENKHEDRWHALKKQNHTHLTSK